MQLGQLNFWNPRNERFGTATNRCSHDVQTMFVDDSDIFGTSYFAWNLCSLLVLECTTTTADRARMLCRAWASKSVTGSPMEVVSHIGSPRDYLSCSRPELKGRVNRAPRTRRAGARSHRCISSKRRDSSPQACPHGVQLGWGRLRGQLHIGPFAQEIGNAFGVRSARIRQALQRAASRQMTFGAQPSERLRRNET